jgi:Phage terminase, small subunit
MPRKSRAAKEMGPVRPRLPRLEVPSSLSQAESALFNRLIDACEPDHFASTDTPLLTAYVQAACLADEAGHKLREEGAVVDGRANAWLIVLEKCQRAMVALSMRLRLSPQSRERRTRSPEHQTTPRMYGGAGLGISYQDLRRLDGDR